jgi:uncharacterized cupredoxin-like copper-binding protein
MRHPIAKALLPALATGLLALAGCGSSSGSSSSSSTETTAASSPATSTSTSSSTPAPAPGVASTLSVAANPEGQLSFDTKSLSAKAGKVSIDFTNKSSLAHNLTVESSSGAVVGATPTFEGASKTLAVTLKAGTYKFYCSVPGHRQAGMEGTITVQ